MKFLKHIIIISLISLLYQFDVKGVYLISLGGDCTVATVLRSLGLRTAAYPFDWMFSHYDPLYKALADDFNHFLDPNSLKIGDDPRIIVDAYGLLFVHDFPTIYHPAALTESETHGWAQVRDDWREFIQPIREKYQRRIERFRSVLSGSEQVFLIRYSLPNRDEAIRLRDLIINRYPYLNFTLVAVSGSAADNTEWGLEKIRNFFVVYGSPDFLVRWQNIFAELGIDPHAVKQGFDCEDDDEGCNGSCKIVQSSIMLEK